MSKTITISDESWEKIKGQIGEDEAIDISSLEEMVGKSFYFRTVTYHVVGKVEKLIGKFAVLSMASWVADSGRFMNAIKEGTLEEVEPIGQMFVNLDTVTDICNWVHALPTEQK